MVCEHRRGICHHRLVLEPAAHEDTSIETAKLKQDMKDERKRHERMNESAKRRKINSLEE